MSKSKVYYLGLDIGTDSIGYAVVDPAYKLLRFKGKSMWGSALFDPASTSQSRRAFRTARRRLDRRQQRVRLLRDFFAAAISKVDPRFFTRIMEAALFAEDRTNPFDNQAVFNDEAFKDADFYGKYPTIHHLILELMLDKTPHDVRLVYVACAWLLAHRGHFLSEISLENVGRLGDITELYDDLMEYMNSGDENGDDGEVHCAAMWECDPVKFGEVLSLRASMSVKREKMFELLWGTANKPKSDDAKYDRYSVVSLLCGCETVKAETLFKNEEYKDVGVISLGAEEDVLQGIVGQLGDDGALILKLKAIYDWAVLRKVMQGVTFISEAKVNVYEQHRKDLLALKDFLRRTDKALFRKVFVNAGKDPNYTAYVYNVKGVKKADKKDFSDWLRKLLGKITPSNADRKFYDDMMSRLETYSFLPKQVDGDNRVIPHQLYQIELRRILENAVSYLPFLNESDKYGTVARKIESIFAFRVPYFVGPLVSFPAGDARGAFAWMKRKADGIIRPWNFRDIVDLDASEDAFIARMTNRCMYIPGEDVLPHESLLYKEFMLLNEINPLKIAGSYVPAEIKMRIVDELFKRKRKVPLSALRCFLLKENLMNPDDELSGIDENIKSNLSSFHDFKGFLDSGKLKEDEVEAIILRSTCTDDTRRLEGWLGNAPFAARLGTHDKRMIARFKYSEFGRLSRRFLDGVEFAEKATGNRGTVMQFLRSGNAVLMELLSNRYTLSEELAKISSSYYADHPSTMESRLDEIYASSSVKRQVYRAFDIIHAVRKAMGSAPAKVFVEMARGATTDQKGKRTTPRLENLKFLFSRVADADVKIVNKTLEDMGDDAHNRLQSEALYLWMLQLGHCAYCNAALPVEDLKAVANIDHILPQSIVKDDSVVNNKVLCCSKCNSHKADVYPVPQQLRNEAFWAKLHENGLMSEEKYRRLVRKEHLRDDELQGFINRQLVETRQTTKAVFGILQDALPKSKIIAVKAGNVSDFRHEFGLVKSRAVNDLHHAKDAYLNVVVGNVYYERFTNKFFNLRERYSMKVSSLFGGGSRVKSADGLAWDGAQTIERVKATVARNDVHLTKYAYYAKGGFFDQMPKPVGLGAIPRKEGLPVLKYGGYAKPSAFGYLPVKYKVGTKDEIIIIPIDLMDKSVVLGEDEVAAVECIAEYIDAIENPQRGMEVAKENANNKQKKKVITVVGFPIGRKILKVNTVLVLDGFPYFIRGKSGGGRQLSLGSLRSMCLGDELEAYVKRLESVSEKLSKKKCLVIDPEYDRVSKERNVNLYDVLAKIAAESGFAEMPASQKEVLANGRSAFVALSIQNQIKCLLSIVNLFKTNRAGGCDLTLIGGAPKAGVMAVGSKVSNWKKSYNDARLRFEDSSGMRVRETGNLLEEI